MRILVDASAWVPMEVRRDQHGPRLRALMLRLSDTRPVFVTTNWTPYEALALARRWGFPAARELYAMAVDLGTIIPVSPPIEDEARRRFLSWQDKTASVVDHANLLVALAADCDAILAFDADFAPLARQAGIELLR